MEFRPCIDIHNGKVKQIVGSSLQDRDNEAVENFISLQDAAWYASLYREKEITGGHIILLNPPDSDYYAATKEQALKALSAYRGGMQIGGGITADNAAEFIQAGASHVIVTSYVFRDGRIHYENLEKLGKAVGRERIVLDLSCKKTKEGYVIVTDRWQRMTREIITESLLDRLAGACSEFLVHAVDVEGKSEGIEEELAVLLGSWGRKPVTYAGGVHNFEDLRKLDHAGKGKLNVTIGSALDLFGGDMKFEEILEYTKKRLPHN